MNILNDRGINIRGTSKTYRKLSTYTNWDPVESTNVNIPGNKLPDEVDKNLLPDHRLLIDSSFEKDPKTGVPTVEFHYSIYDKDDSLVFDFHQIKPTGVEEKTKVQDERSTSNKGLEIPVRKQHRKKKIEKKPSGIFGSEKYYEESNRIKPEVKTNPEDGKRKLEDTDREKKMKIFTDLRSKIEDKPDLPWVGNSLQVWLTRYEEKLIAKGQSASRIKNLKNDLHRFLQIFVNRRRYEDFLDKMFRAEKDKKNQVNRMNKFIDNLSYSSGVNIQQVINSRYLIKLFKT